MSTVNRRSFLMNGAQIGGTSALFLSGLLPSSLSKLFIEKAVAADNPTEPTLVHFVLIDKVQAALFQNIEGNAPPGLDSQNGVARATSDFRSMGLTKLFGDPLAALPSNVALAINNTWESGTNGHNLASATLGAGFGSINAAFDAAIKSGGLLGAVGFALRSDANDSQDAFSKADGTPMKTYSSVGALNTTLQQAVRPLKEVGENPKLIQQMDSLRTKDPAMRNALLKLSESLGKANDDLQAASTLRDPIESQVNAVIALRKAGLSKNFMIAIPYDDTNGGGNLTSGGGTFNLDPFSVTPRIAQALVKLHQEIPNLFTVSSSDGGRDQNNGDRSAGFAFMTGPDSKVKNGIIGPRFTSTNQLGQTLGDTKLSNGATQPTTPSNWYATTLAALGSRVDLPFVPAALV